MSKLVDDAVCDYFSLLLNDAPTVDEVSRDSNRFHGGNVSTALSPQRQIKQRLQSKEFDTAEVEESINQQALAQLLAPVSAPEPALKLTQEPSNKSALVASAQEQDLKIAAASVAEKQRQAELNSTLEAASENQVNATAVTKPSPPPSITKDLVELLDDEFQVLFFKVAGLTLAVPLVSLGGIVNLERINHLMGRPSWYLGVQQHRESQLNVVDTCAWVMPEKYDQTLAQNVAYKYIVVLQDSSWGLTCESLVNTVKIRKSQVNWRSQAGKRPWLAGVVKEQMCGILNVDALIAMLDSGLGSQG